MFNKKYKKGMVDAAKAYEAFGKKQEEAINHILEEVRKQGGDIAEALKNINVNIDGLYDYLQSKEKSQLYTVYTPFDIKDLGKEEQLFLVGALFRLTTDKAPNEHQQDYIRSVQRYLDIKEPPFGTDPLAIENIEDIPAQKAILQAVMEYLYLQDGDSYDETELQQEFLDAFSVNNKGRQAIFEQVERLYHATGARGLAEKYGYVPEEQEGAEEPEPAKNQSASDEKKEVISAEAARMAYEFYKKHSDGIFSKFAESRDYYLTKTRDDFGNDKLLLYNKATGEKKDFPSAYSDLLGDDWDESKYCQNDIFVLTRGRKLFHIETDAMKCNGVLRSQKRLKLLFVGKNCIVLEIDSHVGVFDWDGNRIDSFTDSDINSKWQDGLIFFHDSLMWSLYTGYGGWEKRIWKLYKSTPDFKKMDVVLEYTESFEPEELLVVNSKLYILAKKYETSDYSPRSIFVVQLDAPVKFQKIMPDITIYDLFIHYAYVSPALAMHGSPPTGWVFIGEDGSSRSREFKLMYFSCVNEELTVLTKGCGDYEIKTHIFSEDDILFYIEQIYLIGNYVFFTLGSSKSDNPRKAMVSIFEPNSVHML